MKTRKSAPVGEKWRMTGRRRPGLYVWLVVMCLGFMLSACQTKPVDPADDSDTETSHVPDDVADTTDDGIADVPEGWDVLAGDPGGSVLVYVRRDGDEDKRSTFLIQVNGHSLECVLKSSAWLTGGFGPHVSCLDLTQDGISDAAVIFTTEDDDGAHVEELWVVDGASGELYSLPTPEKALRVRLTFTKSGTTAIESDEGIQTTVPDDACFDRRFFYQISEDNGLTAHAYIGYGDGLYMEESYLVTYAFDSGAFTAVGVSRIGNTQDRGILMIGSAEVPILALGEEERQIGQASVTLSYNEIVQDTRYTGFDKSFGLRKMQLIRSDDPAVTATEIFDRFCRDDLAEYVVQESGQYTRADGYHYPTVQYKATGEGSAAQRQYMYMLEIDWNLYLCISWDRAESVAIENEDSYYQKTAARVEVTDIHYDTAAYADLLLEQLLAKIRTGTETVSVQRDGESFSDFCSPERVPQYLAAMQADRWTYLEKWADFAFLPTLTISVGSFCQLRTTNRDDTLCAYIRQQEDDILICYALPAGTVEALTQLCVDAQNARQQEYQAKLDALYSFLPDGATDRLVCHRIFCSDDYILSFRTVDGSLSLWRAEDIGERYVRLDPEIPDEVAFDFCEVVAATGGGGSGEYMLLLALYNGDSVEYAVLYGWFREPPTVLPDADTWTTVDWGSSYGEVESYF